MEFDKPKYYIMLYPNSWDYSPICVEYGTLKVFDTIEEAKHFMETDEYYKDKKPYAIYETRDDYWGED